MQLMPKFTMLSKLITELQETLKQHGDLPVASIAEGPSGAPGVFTSNITVGIEPYYLDGGYYAPTEDHKYRKANFICSRENPKSLRGSQGLVAATGFPSMYVKLKCYGPSDYDDTINGRELRHYASKEYAWHEELEREDRNFFNGEVPQYRYSKDKDPRSNCHPCIAYLPSGLEAKGDSDGSMSAAKIALARKFDALTRMRSGIITPAVFLASQFLSEREAAELFLKEKTDA